MSSVRRSDSGSAVQRYPPPPPYPTLTPRVEGGGDGVAPLDGRRHSGVAALTLGRADGKKKRKEGWDEFLGGVKIIKSGRPERTEGRGATFDALTD